MSALHASGESHFVPIAEAEYFDEPDPGPVTTTHAMHYFFGERHSDAPGPQGFMVTRGPNLMNRPHFQHVDQYRIFFGSPGSRFAGRQIDPLLVHYADADTVYGPFGSGEFPLSFMTLRAHGSDYQGFLPDDAAEMSPAGPKREFFSELGEWYEGAFPAAGESSNEVIIAAEPDGLVAYRIDAGPGTTFTTPDGSDGGGQYQVVVGGEVLLGGKKLPRLTVGWVPAASGLLGFEAGPEGAKLVVMQYRRMNAA